MRKAFLFSLLFILGLGANAQYISHGGMFKVDEIRGCAPFTIKITATNLDGMHDCTCCGPGTTSCIMYFNGTGSSQQFQYTYNTPGNYRLLVQYTVGIVDYIDITVDPNIQPAFDIYSCAGSKVQINITDKNYDKYDINFNAEIDATVDQTINSSSNQIATFSYGAPGLHTITVKGKKTNASNNCNLKSSAFSAITTLPIPTISTLKAKSIDSLLMGFTPSANIGYKSEIATNSGTNFQGYPMQYGVNSLTVPNVNVDNNYYCLRLNSFDPCAAPNGNTYSAPVCSHKFDVTATNGIDLLAWQTWNPVGSKILIQRNNILYKTVDGADTSYPDDSITCKMDYTYQLISKHPSGSGGAISTSLKKTVKAIKTTTPTAINNTSAVVNEPQVDLVWVQDPLFKVSSYQVLRNVNGGPYLPIGNSTSTNYADKSYSNAGYCYQINYTDKCDNKSALGLPACPVVLTGVPDENNDVKLDWSAYVGWDQDVATYSILRHYPGQASTPISPLPGSLTHTDHPNPANQVVYYRILATPKEPGVATSLSNEIKVVRNVNLYYPTAFNPDSQVSPLDRTFSVKGHFITSMKLQIFDRWGSLVFYSDENEAWDGKREGMPMPDATYVWTADGTDLAGNSFKRAGTVILIRKK